jgi:hypothetical protein
MIVFRFTAAAAGLGALYLTGLTAGQDSVRQGPDVRDPTHQVLAHQMFAQPAAFIGAMVAAIPAHLAALAPRGREAVPPAPAVVAALPEPIDFTPTGSLEAMPPPLPALNRPAPPALVAEPPPDASRLAAAAALYRKGDQAGGDAIARTVADPLQRTAIEWTALRLAARPDDRRLAAFAAAHPAWPGGDWIRDVQEAHLYTEHPAPRVVAALFAADPPHTPTGELAAARAALDAGRRDEAIAMARKLWREGDFDRWTENAVL